MGAFAHLRILRCNCNATLLATRRQHTPGEGPGSLSHAMRLRVGLRLGDEWG